jgi:hypothetical protein
MTISMQGTWTVSVSSKSAAWGQRFEITGSSNGADNTYAGATSTAPVSVEGDQWGITVENDPAGPVSWRPSRMRFAQFRVESGQFKVDIQTDDGGGSDEDFNDLVLTASMALSSTDWVVYGTARAYEGHCLWNPCFPGPFIVIDTFSQLERLYGYPEIRPIIENVYGTQLLENRRGAESFTPVLLSLGGRLSDGYTVSGRTELKLVEARGKGKNLVPAHMAPATKAQLSLAISPDYAATISRPDALTIGTLKPLFNCEIETLSEELLRLVEYDRTDDELSGGAYTGTGDRDVLGLTATDEFGNYVFRFSPSFSDIITEVVEDVAPGEDASVAARPDIIIQLLDGLPDDVAYETAPFYNIPNVRRIDLCIPKRKIGIKTCSGDRLIEYLGDINASHSYAHSTLHGDGTVSNTALAEDGPVVEHAAWRGSIRVSGCIGDTAVKFFTVEAWRQGATGWTFVSTPLGGARNIGGVIQNDTFGPNDRQLRINGSSNPKVNVLSFRNVESEPGWMSKARQLKALLHTAQYVSTPAGRPFGAAWFRIRGYDKDGERVSTTTDSQKLLIDLGPAGGMIDSIQVPGAIPSEDCALIELPTAGTPLEIKLKADDLEGFLATWNVTAVRGSNNPIGLIDQATAAPVGQAYVNVAPYRLRGTPTLPTADINGFVTLTVAPAGGDWLGGHEFCAASFELHVRDRRTDGRTADSTREVWDEVIGMKLGTP